MNPPFTDININGRIYYQPQAKQQQFHDAINNRDENGLRDFLYGGAAKGGKSYALRWEAHRNCLQYAGIRGLLIRSSFPELERTHLRDLSFDLPREIGSYNSMKHTYTYWNKSILEFGYGNTIDDFIQYLSANYDFIMIDELTTIPFYLSYMFRLRLQASRKDFIPFFACATNPGGKAHGEVRSYFVKKDADNESYPGYDPKRICFIPATVDDNKILMERDPEIVTRLEQLPYAEQQKYRYGNWDIFEGMFWEDFRYSQHIIRNYKFSKLHASIGGLDYGNVTVIEVMQRDAEGTVVVGAECYLPDLTNPSDRANALADFLLEKELYQLDIIYDTDMEISQLSNIGVDKTPIAIFRDVFKQRMGEKAPRMRVVNKKSLDKNKPYRVVVNSSVKEYLSVKKVCSGCKQPLKRTASSCEKKCNAEIHYLTKLFITEECKHLIKFLSEAIYDPNDLSGGDFERTVQPKKDHPYDAFKYGFMELHAPKIKPEDPRPKWLQNLFKDENRERQRVKHFMAS
jgi:hypothetical protein